MPFLRQRQLNDLIESIDHLATVNADLIDIVNTAAGKWEAANTPARMYGGWVPDDAAREWAQRTSARAEALGIVEEVHRAPDGTDEPATDSADTPLIATKESCD